MKVSEIQRRVADIAAKQQDPESAHGLEDALYLDVLKAISAGAPNAKDLAEAALKAAEMKFVRI